MSVGRMLYYMNLACMMPMSIDGRFDRIECPSKAQKFEDLCNVGLLDFTNFFAARHASENSLEVISPQPLDIVNHVLYTCVGA